MDHILLQILVVVANTKEKCLRTEVEKGSTRIAFIRGLFDPKLQINFEKRIISKIYFLELILFSAMKGKKVNIPSNYN